VPIGAWAADVTPTKAPSSPPDSTGAPPPCADPSDFITTNCQLTWHGITVFGIVDTGFGWQSHGTPFDPQSAVGSSYLIQKQNRGSIWTLAPNALSNSFIVIKEPSRSAGTFLLYLISTPASTRIPCNSRTDPDQLLRTTAFPKICKVPTPTQAERASGTMAKATSASVLRPMAH
jgi:hypothetical protein